MVHFSGHKLHNVDVVRAEAYDEGEEDEEDNGVGLMVPPRSACHGVLLGRGPQLQVDFGIAAQDDDQRAAEGHGAGQEQEIRGQAGGVEVEVLHAGPSSLVLTQHAAEQQRGYLQGDQSPDQAADPANHPGAPQSLQPVGMHHGQISVQTDAGHEANTWWKYSGTHTDQAGKWTNQ